MNSVKEATDALLSAIKSSEEYLSYRDVLEKVLQDPALKAQIDEFRRRNFMLQTSQDIDFEKLDRFEKEYEYFRQNPLVSDFLAAEVDLCRMIQDITMRITGEIDFQ
ncbi:MAG: YlbF family regulator [Acetatifactor sp.]|nr:YlbF family regulator [Acetatifactor sp.]